jgi:hypothetical protein
MAPTNSVAATTKWRNDADRRRHPLPEEVPPFGDGSLVGHARGEVGAERVIGGVAYVVAACCFVQCIVFLFEIAKIWRGEYE